MVGQIPFNSEEIRQNQEPMTSWAKLVFILIFSSKIIAGKSTENVARITRSAIISFLTCNPTLVSDRLQDKIKCIPYYEAFP